MINNLTYKIFEEIEKRGLQFAIPEKWKTLYREFRRERIRRCREGSYKDDFGKQP